MDIEDAKKVINESWLFTTNHVLDDENKKLKIAIETVLNELKEDEKIIKDYEKWCKAVQEDLDDLVKMRNKVEASEMVHNYDVKMIDEVKGRNVELYNEIEKKDKIIDMMAEEIFISRNWALTGNKKAEDEIEDIKYIIIKEFEGKVANE